MGSASSKFKKYLQNGDEFAAMQVFQANAAIQGGLDPNCSYGESQGHNTPLHYASQHAMKHLCRAFLFELGGNPNKRNSFDETSLHKLCLVRGPAKSPSAEERRYWSLIMMLQWRGALMDDGRLETVQIMARDKYGNSALHNAACSGLLHVTKLLLHAQADIFARNTARRTACHMAAQEGHDAVAAFLETRMIFADILGPVNPPLTPNTSSLQPASYSSAPSTGSPPTTTTTASSTTQQYSDDLDYHIDTSLSTLRSDDLLTTVNTLATFHNNNSGSNNIANVAVNNLRLLNNASGNNNSNILQYQEQQQQQQQQQNGSNISEFINNINLGNLMGAREFSMDDLEDVDRDIINVRNLLVSRHSGSGAAAHSQLPHRCYLGGDCQDEADIEDILELDEDLLDAAGLGGGSMAAAGDGGSDGDSRIQVSDTVISEGSEGYTGLKAHELMEAKDQLLVETSDMLHVPLFTAEALLRHYEWSKSQLLEAWMEDPVACCNNASIVPPASLLHRLNTMQQREECGDLAKLGSESDDKNKTSEANPSDPSTATNAVVTATAHDVLCGICFEEIKPWDLLQTFRKSSFNNSFESSQSSVSGVYEYIKDDSKSCPTLPSLASMQNHATRSGAATDMIRNTIAASSLHNSSNEHHSTDGAGSSKISFLLRRDSSLNRTDKSSAKNNMTNNISVSNKSNNRASSFAVEVHKNSCSDCQENNCDIDSLQLNTSKGFTLSESVFVNGENNVATATTSCSQTNNNSLSRTCHSKSRIGQSKKNGLGCSHLFCSSCWRSYLSVKIHDGDANNIQCPAVGCNILVDVEFIERMVSPEMARRYMQFDIQAFVERNKSLKWCPHPGCGRAVRFPQSDVTQETAHSSSNFGAASVQSSSNSACVYGHQSLDVDGIFNKASVANGHSSSTLSTLDHHPRSTTSAASSNVKLNNNNGNVTSHDKFNNNKNCNSSGNNKKDNSASLNNAATGVVATSTTTATTTSSATATTFSISKGGAEGVWSPSSSNNSTPQRRADPSIQWPPILQPQQLQPLPRSVDCGNGHFFCWECLDDAHSPASCLQWRSWRAKVAEVRPDELHSSAAGNTAEEAANLLWLVANSKPCPNCKSPIQKNEGCNHMKCSKCKLEFCWVCLESWKKHSSATGGYFRCNRYEAQAKAHATITSLLHQASQRNHQMQELTRFLHHYSRYSSHRALLEAEVLLLHSVTDKMNTLSTALQGQCNKTGEDCSVDFLSVAVKELVKARLVLCACAVMAYFTAQLPHQSHPGTYATTTHLGTRLDRVPRPSVMEMNRHYNTTLLDCLQNELSNLTERLDDMVSRRYMVHRRATVIATTLLTRHTRTKLLRFVERAPPPIGTTTSLRYDRPTSSRPFNRMGYVVPPSHDELPSHFPNPYELIHELALGDGLASRYYDFESRNHRQRWQNSGISFSGLHNQDFRHSPYIVGASNPLQGILQQPTPFVSSVVERDRSNSMRLPGRVSDNLSRVCNATYLPITSHTLDRDMGSPFALASRQVSQYEEARRLYTDFETH